MTDNLPKIYAFYDKKYETPHGGPVVAITAEGKLLAGHFSSSEDFACADISTKYKEENFYYVEYPGGYKFVYVSGSGNGDKDFLEAKEKYHAKKEEKEKEKIEKKVKDKLKNPEFTYADLQKTDRDWQFTLQWGAKGLGFGEFTFFYKDGKLMLDNECMSKSFVKKALCAMVDNCESVD